jgi:hypothetical protein
LALLPAFAGLVARVTEPKPLDYVEENWPRYSAVIHALTDAAVTHLSEQKRVVGEV